MAFEYEPGDYIARVAPTPRLMIVADNDALTATEKERGALRAQKICGPLRSFASFAVQNSLDPQRQAAIGHQAVAGDEGGIVGGEEQDGLGHVLRLAEATER